MDVLTRFRSKVEVMSAGGVTQQRLADEYGVHQAQVSKYVRGTQRTWK